MTLEEINPKKGQMIRCLNLDRGFWQWGKIQEVRVNNGFIIKVNSDPGFFKFAQDDQDGYSEWFENEGDACMFFKTFEDMKVYLL